MSASSPRRQAKKLLVAIPAFALAAGGLMATTAPQASAAAAPKMPNTAKLAGKLAKQKLVWDTCDYGDPGINQRFQNLPNVKCTDVFVPRDWHNPGDGTLLAIKVAWAKNIDSSNPRYKGTMFVNPGGPGGDGLPWAAAMQERTPDLNPYYNYVGFDPRGVGQSPTRPCAFKTNTETADKYRVMKDVAAQCAKDPYISVINTEQTTYDMDFIRGLLSAPKLSYVGYSYGTWLGAWYEKIFGPNTDKVLLDSATDVTQPTLQRTWEIQPKARDRQFEMHMMNWIARQDATYKLGTDPRAIHQRYVNASAKMDSVVVQLIWQLTSGANGFSQNAYYPASAAAVQSVIELGEKGGNTAGAKADPASVVDAALAKMSTTAKTAQARSSAKQGRQKLQPLLSLARSGARKAPTFATPNAAGTTSDADNPDEGLFADPFDMIRCNDGQWTQGTAYWQNLQAKGTKLYPVSASWGALEVPLCAFWRTNNMMPVADSSFPKTIVGQGEMDSQTAYETGFATGTKLPNTSAIFIDNEGSHGHFPYGTECYDRPIYNYFLKGKMPKNVTVCQALPLPNETTTFETWGKLNARGKQTPVNGGPFTPATTAAKVATTGAPLTIEDGQLKSKVRASIFKIYGQKGVDSLVRSGAL